MKWRVEVNTGNWKEFAESRDLVSAVVIADFLRLGAPSKDDVRVIEVDDEIERLTEY